MEKIIVTLGDPLGIGPEIIVKSICKLSKNSNIHWTILGEAWLLQEMARQLQLADYWAELEQQERLQIQSFQLFDARDYIQGTPGPSIVGGKASYTYFNEAVKMCLSGQASKLVTAPICKESLHLARYPYMGHTDILEKMCSCEVVMTLVHPKLVVAHVTDHLPLIKAIAAVTPRRIREVVMQTQAFLQKSGRSGTLALAGLNPHAGENGILGSEELEILIPVRKQLQLEGIPVEGPFPADTLFFRALRGEFSAVIAMYHDQGFAPMKTLDMAQGVNATLGLPFVRTSPDHGTAFDLSGKFTADESSMTEAIKVALEWKS